MPSIRFILALVAVFAAFPAGARSLDPVVPDEAQIPIAILLDLGSGQVLHERNADRRFVPASITKVMTTYVAFELLREGKLQRNQRFTVRPETFRQWRRKGSTMFLPRDARVSVEQLIHGITTVSANDASVVLAEGAVGSVEQWTVLMNEKARAIGMTNSHYANPNGWMDEGRTFVTARDLTRLATAMIARHPDYFRHFVGRSQYRYNNITQPNRDPLIGKVRGADGIKTGFTYEAGFGFLGTAKRSGRRLVMVVGGADSGRIRDRAARQYIEWGFDAFDSRFLFGARDIVGAARVQNGDRRTVGLVSETPIRVSVPRGSNAQLAMRIDYEGPLKAPIAAGEEIAQLVVNSPGMPEARIPLQAAEAVKVAGPLDRVINAVMGWFA